MTGGDLLEMRSAWPSGDGGGRRSQLQGSLRDMDLDGPRCSGIDAEVRSVAGEFADRGGDVDRIPGLREMSR